MRNVESIFGGVTIAPKQTPYTYIAVGGETSITIPFAFVTFLLSINSGVQTPGNAYAVEGRVIQLADTPETGDEFFFLFDTVWSPKDGYTDYMTERKYIAAVGETVYTPGIPFSGVMVYVNGDTKYPGDYFVADGSKLTWTAPMLGGENVYLVFKQHSVWLSKYALVDDVAATYATKESLDDVEAETAINLSAAIQLALDNLANTSDLNKGDAEVGVLQPYVGAVASNQHKKNQDVVTVEDFGAKSGGGQADAHINSIAFQRALTAIYLRGGGEVKGRGGVYYLDYPIYLRDNTNLNLKGMNVVFLNPTFNLGRGGIVIGSSHEANRETALAAYAANTYPAATTINAAYVNPALKQYLRDNPSFIEATNCTVYGGKVTALHTVAGGNGGYGVNFVNAKDSFCHDVVFEGWTQAIGMGSDGTPETPSNHNCHAYNLTIISGDLVKTYYSVGFISNSTACTIRDAVQINPLTVGSPNGSACATNYVEDCHFKNIRVLKLGRTASSEGVLLNNAKGSSATGIHIGDAVSAVSTYYTDATFNDPAKPNFIDAVFANGCDYALSLRAKYAVVGKVEHANGTYGDVYWGNNNASDNVLNFTPKQMVFGGSNYPATFLTLNTVKGWRYQYAYLRPGDMLLNDRADTSVVASSKVIGAKASVNLAFSYQLPASMRAVNDVRMFLTFNTGSLTAGSTMAITLRRMAAFDGNLGETAYVEMTNSRAAVADTLQDTSLVAQVTGSAPGYVLAADTTHGLANAWELYITATNNVLNNYVKEARIGFWGD